MGKKGRIIGAAAGVAAAAAATTAAVIANRNPELRKKIGDAASRMVSRSKTYHVKKSGDQWAIELEGASRATSLHATKKEAVSAARDLAAGKRPSQLVIHRVDGTIQDSHTYEKED